MELKCTKQKKWRAGTEATGFNSIIVYIAGGCKFNSSYVPKLIQYIGPTFLS